MTKLLTEQDWMRQFRAEFERLNIDAAVTDAYLEGSTYTQLSEGFHDKPAEAARHLIAHLVHAGAARRRGKALLASAMLLMLLFTLDIAFFQIGQPWRALVATVSILSAAWGWFELRHSTLTLGAAYLRIGVPLRSDFAGVVRSWNRKMSLPHPPSHYRRRSRR